MLTYILFGLGFALLVKGADFLVDGASSIAKRLRISDIAIGLTIVAFGTSMPELIVNIMASFSGKTDIAIGNIVGSNIANILLILGISAIIRPLTVKKNTTWKELPLSLLTTLILALMVNDRLIDHENFSHLSRIDGLVLIGFFLIFLYYTFGISKVKGVEHEHIRARGVGVSFLMILGGVAALTLGGSWVVDGAVAIARVFGLSEALIGLTIVAVGTSLPELVTSTVAAYRGNMDIAVGNVVGSNIFNILWILGVSSLIRTLPFSTDLNVDVFVTVIVTFLLFLAMFIGRRHTLDRWQGGMFVLFYIIYIVYLVWRG